MTTMQITHSTEFLASAFGPENGTGYRLSAAVSAAFPNQHVLAIESVFDLEEYARLGECRAVVRREPHAEIRTGWRRSSGLWSSVTSGVFDVEWRGESLVAVHARWPEGFQTRACWYVVSEDKALAERFTSAVCEACNDPRDAVLAFRGGCWSKDFEIYRSIQSASFDDLVLAGELSREIRDDFTSFLASKEEYERYGVPWKRGVLFLGPPGNGKTHCLRATIKMLGIPCLYVQSFKSRYETDDANIALVFDRARQITPCCLVFEDLDAMITDANRSTFLNQLDGFANASGMLTLATTNHPEKLDPAILDRPSRFDRKYHFTLPELVERRRYIAAWSTRLEGAMRLTDGQIDSLAEETAGFSFAYLKELFLSAMIRWIRTREEGAMLRVLRSQLDTLRDQMRTDLTRPPAPVLEPPDSE